MSTADFLAELGTEELPPKALRSLMDSFVRGVRSGLDDARLGYGNVRGYASPRRLAVIVEDLELRQEDREVQQKGPPVRIAFDDEGEPTKAALAFAAKCGVEVGDLGREKSDAGEWLSHRAVEAGAEAASLLPGIALQSLESLPIPRRMRWGDSDAEFVRPVHWLIMLLGDQVVPGEMLGIQSGDRSRGHRFQGGQDIRIASAGDYVEALRREGRVIVDFVERRQLIVDAVETAARDAGGSPVGDDELYDEVTALTEWPVPLTGSFDEEYLDLPDEVIIATLTSHQRYFPVRGGDGRLLPVFITLANLESKEPDRVRDGNERVIRPRLADAKFFWDTDQQTALGQRTDDLKKVVYQQGLGTLHDKSMRVAALATLLADQLNIDPADVTRAAVLAKCDLLTGMVGEFPELQGKMGSYYAAASGEDAAVSQAIGDQYMPRFAGDELPASAGGQVLAVADKLDTLAGIFALGKKPSGNRDPFGLRRAALGVIRILVEKQLDVDLCESVKAAVIQQPVAGEDHGEVRIALYEFILDRLKSYFLEQQASLNAEMFEAVRARQPSSLVDFAQRLAAVAVFIELEEAVSLAAANKRTANILRQAGVEESDELASLDLSLLVDDAERVLYHAMQSARKDVTPLIAERDYGAAMRRLAELRSPVDAFFDDVMVMADDEALRTNRLALLAELRSLFLGVADISRLTPAAD
jgi:glycyl-tRNA synthetase beta chain